MPGVVLDNPFDEVETKTLKGSKGFERDELPQIKGEDVDKFLAFLRRKGVEVEAGETKVADLKPTQSELNQDKVEKLAKDGRTDALRSAIIISSDDYILDGHHRWAAVKKLDKDDTIRTKRADVPIKRLIQLGHEFPKSFTKAVDEAALDETVQQLKKYLLGTHQVVDHGTVGLFRVYSVTPYPTDTSIIAVRNLRRIHGARWSYEVGKVRTVQDYHRDRASGYDSVTTVVDPAADEWAKIRANLQEASNAILTLGVPRQRDTLILLDLSAHKNPITGGGVGGYAYRKTHAIELDAAAMAREGASALLVHEWGHKQFFNLPQHVTDYVRDWFRANLVQRDDLHTIAELSDKRKATLVEWAWERFNEAWRAQRGLDLEDFLVAYKRAQREGVSDSQTDRLLDYVSRGKPTAHGIMLKGVRNPDGGRGLRKGDRARVFSARATGPDQFVLMGAGMHLTLSRRELLDVFELDFGRTKKENPDVDIEQFAYSANAIASADPVRMLTLEHTLWTALDAAGRWLAERFKAAGHGNPSLMDVMTLDGHKRFQEQWMERVQREKLDFDPKKAFIDIYADNVTWPEARRTDDPLVRSATLTGPDGERVRALARELKITPSSYAAANVDELWAELIAHTAMRPSSVPKPLKDLFRNAMQGKTSGAGPRARVDRTPEQYRESIMEDALTFVGRAWDSLQGPRRVVGTVEVGGKPRLRVQTGDSNQHELVDPAELEREIQLDTSRLVRRNAASSSATPSLDDQGFLATLTPMQAGRAREALLKSRVFRGRLTSVAEIVKQLVAAGARVERDRLLSPDGSYLDIKAIPKVAMDFARHLALRESLEESEVTKPQLDALERQLDALFKAAGIDIEFTRHFLDRVNDPRNGRPITIEELQRVYRAVWDQQRAVLDKADVDWKAVIRDLPTQINIPVVLDYDTRTGRVELVAKTIMRAARFMAREPQLVVRSEAMENNPGVVQPIWWTEREAHRSFKKRATTAEEVLQHAKVGLMVEIDGHAGRITKVTRSGDAVSVRITTTWAQPLKPFKFQAASADESWLATKHLPVKGEILRFLADRGFGATEDQLWAALSADRFFRADRAELRRVLKALSSAHRLRFDGEVYTFVEGLMEGVDDPHVLKAVFLAGGGGSGKSFIGKKTFGDTGLRVVNTDPHFERLMQKAGLDTKKDVGSPEAQKLRPRAKEMAAKQEKLLTAGRVGIIIDGTGDNPEKIAKKKAELEALGYDTSMVFVDVPLDVALARNKKRARVVPEDVLKEAHKLSQEAKETYKKMFGGKYANVVNDKEMTPEEITRDLVPKLARVARRLVDGPVENPVGRKWIKSQLASGERHRALGKGSDTAVSKPEEKPDVDAPESLIRWRTTKRGQKLGFDRKGRVVAGNPHLLKLMRAGRRDESVGTPVSLGTTHDLRTIHGDRIPPGNYTLHPMNDKVSRLSGAVGVGYLIRTDELDMERATLRRMASKVLKPAPRQSVVLNLPAFARR